jgi:uncharacterized protein with HEPN domain
MSNQNKALNRVKVIKKKIEFINEIVSEKGGIYKALEDEKSSRAAILMHLTSIAEQFDKLLHSGELKILGFFEKEDIKGSYELRNFIAHDYEGVNLHIIEDVIRYRLPVILKATNQILQKEKQ